MAQYAHLSEPDPEFAAIAPSSLPPPPDLSAPAALQKHWIDTVQPTLWAPVYKSRLTEDAQYRVEDHKVPVDDGEIVVRVVTPGSNDLGETFPVIVWFHGGGWVLGNVDQDDYQLRLMSTELRAVTVNVDYRTAPEHPYPTPWDDSFAAVKWVATNAGAMAADLAKGFVLGGVSAGGNIAAVLAHRVRDDAFFARTPLTGQYKSELLSEKQNDEAPCLNRALREFFQVQVKAPPHDPGFAPLLQPSHAGLPPAYLQICGLDPLRDEGLLYARVLREAGIAAKLDVYPGVPHCFNVWTPDIKLAVKYEADTMSGLKWLLTAGK
ncbi:alpha/beta-hydrolase [Auriscalpium vulgare]|uniref:Alpha/beta-hydrolase n=1 Tax=Auriscalpium vulgare TaxID=40419 RepID=A0ACB8SBH8_9AGAM|nr:alpha/beta-hydrolase [Auriscalpium vulgare]